MFSASCKKDEDSTHVSNRKKKPLITQQDRAILDLKLTRDGLLKFEQNYEAEAIRLLAKAQEMYRAENKQKAVYFMKVRKLKTAKVDSLRGELLTIEDLINSIEWGTQSKRVFDAMKIANAALKEMQDTLPIEKVEELVDEIDESKQIQNEIDAALSSQNLVVDDDEINSELDIMMSQATETSNAAQSILPTNPTSLPEAPSGQISIQSVEKENRDQQAQLLANS